METQMYKFAEDSNAAKTPWYTTVGDHLKKYKKEYGGAAIGAVAGVPNGIAISNTLGLSPTEKVITIIASSAAMGGLGSHVMGKSAAEEGNPRENPAPKGKTDKPWYSKTWDSIVSGAKATGEHLSNNRWTYLGGAGGAVAGGAGGMVAGDVFNMTPAEKLTTVIALSLAGGATGAVVGSKYNPTKGNKQ